MTEAIHPLEQLLLRRWGWKQEPPITTIPQLARYLHVSPTSVYNWFNGSAQPDHRRLVAVAELTGLPLHDLLVAAGYSVPPDPDGAWDMVLDQVRSVPGLDDTRRGQLVRDLEEIRRLYRGAESKMGREPLAC